SRRRHTRFARDWSSDVCSSDLGALPEQLTVCRQQGNVIQTVFDQRPESFLTVFESRLDLLTLCDVGDEALQRLEPSLGVADALQIGRASCRAGGWTAGAARSRN